VNNPKTKRKTSPRPPGRATEEWCERQSANQLPVPYFHRVFTLPHRLNPWVQPHPEVIYRALFQAAWGTLDAFGHDPKRLGGQLGMTGVLHTWGQTLCQHVHLHCMVPGGALADDGSWVPARGSYLFPVRALSRHFRGRFVSALRSAAKAGELTGIDPGAVSALLDALMGEEWVVFAKPCLGACRTWDCPTAEKRISAGFSDPFARPIPAPSPCGAIAQIRSRRICRQIATAILLNRSKNPTRSRFPSLRTPKSDRLLGGGLQADRGFRWLGHERRSFLVRGPVSFSYGRPLESDVKRWEGVLRPCSPSMDTESVLEHR
jgi:hypothetical protein